MSAVGSSRPGAATTLAELAADPHPRLARHRAHEPVSWLPELDGAGDPPRSGAERDARPRDLHRRRPPVLHRTGRRSEHAVPGGDEHARHREPFTAPFRPREVRVGFASFIERETERLITALEPAGAVELRRAFAGPLAVAVVTEALGLVGTTADTVLSWYDSIVRSVSDITAGHAGHAAGAEAYARLRAAVEATVSDPGTASLLGSAAERLALPEVASNAAVLMFGGIETTEAMITNALLHLLRHPGQLALVRDDDGLLDGAIEESLRLEPERRSWTATPPVTPSSAGLRLLGGELVTVSLAGANRARPVFPDPDRFDVRRENARLQLAFAHGPHYCLAAHLARLETRIALQRLLERLPALRLDPARPAAPQGLVFRKPPTLHVLWDSPA